MNSIEKLILLASLCLPIWMGEVMDYVHNIENLLEILSHEEEILGCLQYMGSSF
jgi:hypothetical protein